MTEILNEILTITKQICEDQKRIIELLERHRTVVNISNSPPIRISYDEQKELNRKGSDAIVEHFKPKEGK